MVDDAISLMPASLRLALEARREAVRKGAVAPGGEEDDPSHVPSSRGGQLERSVAERAAALRASIEKPDSFKRVAWGFGALAHFVADAGFPPVSAGGDGVPRPAEFANFCESRRERIPLVFYGHDDADLAGGDYAAFAGRVIEDAGKLYPSLARAYREAGNPPNPAAFDDRSVPFAVASLSYSRTVTDIVRVWLEVWRGSRGDTANTPYLSTPSKR
jgi:hypothetical protein